MTLDMRRRLKLSNCGWEQMTKWRPSRLEWVSCSELLQWSIGCRLLFQNIGRAAILAIHFFGCSLVLLIIIQFWPILCHRSIVIDVVFVLLWFPFPVVFATHRHRLILDEHIYQRTFYTSECFVYDKRHLDRFSCFCRAHDCNRPTDLQTDRHTTLLSVQ